ncbi:uncharacterized protein LOC110044083 [Orbicella faveolata]|uniref:uncharacterized protein LOC110044083 n=1 Tax=Orbicella faveolata TaxID=48498 RepID=UPI0009E28972|nr:uncharacterized protein LOC110044083 [Orbicella faveolata]
MRGGKIFNTEMEKKSVYLGGRFFDKDKINGDPMLLHHVIKSKHLDMTSLEKLTQQELRSICEECNIEKVSSLSKALLIQRLQSLYSSLLTGSSPCHGFTHVRGHTGGFYHMVCCHGCFPFRQLWHQNKLLQPVSVPELVTAEFSASKLDSKSLKADSALQHPLTQSTQRYVVGD